MSAYRTCSTTLCVPLHHISWPSGCRPDSSWQRHIRSVSAHLHSARARSYQSHPLQPRKEECLKSHENNKSKSGSAIHFEERYYDNYHNTYCLKCICFSFLTWFNPTSLLQCFSSLMDPARRPPKFPNLLPLDGLESQYSSLCLRAEDTLDLLYWKAFGYHETEIFY